MKKNYIKRLVSTLILVTFIFTSVPTALADFIGTSYIMSPLEKRLEELRLLNEAAKTPFIDENEETTEENEEELLINESQTLSEEEQELLNKINNNPIIISSDQSTDSTLSVDEELYTELVPIGLEEELITTSASTASSTIVDEFKVDPVNSVFNVANNNNDYVSEATGALTYKKTLLSLPGANGLDLDLNIQYNSSDAVVTENEFVNINAINNKISFNNFAIGWSFGFTTIIKSKDKYGYSTRAQLSFPDGSSYRIAHDSEYNNPKKDTILTLENYYLSDMTLVKKANTNDYELTYSDGKTETFDGTYGYIKQIKDRFGNKIDFTWGEFDYYRGSFIDYMFNPSYYDLKIIALTKIIDSAGRIINLEYNISNTLYGKEVKEIIVKMNNITYSTVYLDRMSSLNGTVDVISKIKDASGYYTNYEYDEKVSHIYSDGLETTYEINGSIFTLKSILLPTGGTVNYEYEKYRRAYKSLNSDTPFWYEVYKISKVSDSSGFERIYEYENDYSGYPYSFLYINPYDDSWHPLTNYTGYVYSSSFNYYCFIKENGITTVSQFNHKHNKIKEESYLDTNTQNNYVVGNGTSLHQILFEGDIYHFGRKNTNYPNNEGGISLYKQNMTTGEITILNSLDETVSASFQVRNLGNHIYLMYKAPPDPENQYYRLVAKDYNVYTNSWTDAGEMDLIGYSNASNFNVKNMYYNGSKLYSWSVHDGVLCHAIYTPLGTESYWNYYEYDTETNNNNFVYLCHVNSNVYYNYNKNNKTDCIYEYNLDTNTATKKYFDVIQHLYTRGGFEFEGRTFIFDNTRICEFNCSTGTINTYYFYDSLTLRPYLTIDGEFFAETYKLQKGLDGYIYYISTTANSDGKYNIYKFMPDNPDDKYLYVGSRMMNNTIDSFFSDGTPSNPVLYVVSDGTEKISLYEPETPQSTTRTTITYNTYNQPVESKVIKISGTNEKTVGTESYVYHIAGKSIIKSTTDIMGNKTAYEYTDSTYFIPTKITQYAQFVGTDDADKSIVTNYTLSEDKTKVVSEQTAYSDKTIKKQYTYGNTLKPGNVTSESLYEITPETLAETLILQTDFTYDTTNTLIASITKKNVVTNNEAYNPEITWDLTVSYEYNDLGLVTKQTDDYDRVTNHGYNHQGWLLWTVYPDETTVDYDYIMNNMENSITTTYNESYVVKDYYDGLGRQIKQTESAVNGTESTLLTYQYDTHHRVSKATDALGNYSVYTYDNFDRVTNIKQYNSTGTLLTQDIITYDDYNMKRNLNDSGYTSTTYYDNYGRLIKNELLSNSGTKINETFYDHAGNVIKEKDSLGNETLYTYNTRGLLSAVTDPTNKITEYQYDIFGNVLTVKNAGVTKLTNTYDAVGNLLKSTDAMGLSDKYHYDKLGRVITHRQKNGAELFYTYKLNTDYVNYRSAGPSSHTFYTYDDFGNLLTAQNDVGTFTYSYTYNNLLESIETPDGKEITYEYDANHNVSKVTDYSGDVIDYTYTGLNNLSSIKRNNTTVANYSYDNISGLVNTITYPNKVRRDIYYDNARRYTEIMNYVYNTSGRASMFNDFYSTYDKNDNITRIDTPDDYHTMSYDNLNRLTSVLEEDNSVSNFTFDSQNNITQKSITHTATDTVTVRQNSADVVIDNITSHIVNYTYDSNDRMTSESHSITGKNNGNDITINYTKTHTYDNNGNLLESVYGGDFDPRFEEFSYNALNQLVQHISEDAIVTNYKYAPDGMRYSKTVGGVETKYYWDRGYISAEGVGDTITARNYIGLDGVFARQTADGTSYMVKNNLGDVVALVKDGVVTKEYSYYAYGGEIDPDPTDTNPFRYRGEYTDIESGLVYLRNRVYNPKMQRFITVDPIKDGLNWYSYANNNPIKFVDPWGLEHIVVSGGVYSDENSHEGYRYNFIEPAIKKISELAQLGDNENITWIIADEGWTDDEKRKFQNAIDSLSQLYSNNMHIEMISNKDELIDYINNKNGSDRSIDPIRKIVFFSHGFMDGTVSLGYNYGIYNTNLDIKESDLIKINGSAFENPNSMFYSCNTGNINANSFAQSWVNTVGGKTWAYNSKTDYSTMPIGESWLIKLSRFKNNFSFVGSANYPSAVPGGSAKLFIQ